MLGNLHVRFGVGVGVQLPGLHHPSAVRLHWQLAAIGVPRLRLVDFDTVDLTNVTTQGYLAGDVGRPKVEATAAAIANSIRPLPSKPSRIVTGPGCRSALAVFCAVTPSTPAGHSGAGGPRCRFWADGRMFGEVFGCCQWPTMSAAITIPRRSLPRPKPNRVACTARSTIYAASIAAGLMIHQFARWLRGLPVDRDTSLNLLAGEWAIS